MSNLDSTMCMNILRSSSIWVVLLLCSLFSTRAFAHEIKAVVVDARALDNSTIEWVMRINLEAAMANISADHDDTDSDPNKEQYESLRSLSAAELTDAFMAVSSERLQRFVLVDEHLQPLSSQVVFVDVIPADNDSIARDTLVTVESTLAPGSKQWTWQWQDSYAPVILRFNDNEQPENNVSHFIEARDVSPVISVTGPQVQLSVAQTVIKFIHLGFIHIIPKGLDHIVFVLGLVLLHPRFKPVLWQVTIFTLAHSITLGLAMLGKVSLPALWVEASIALSIFYIGIDNFKDRAMNWMRLMVVFIFGLLHGLGFANVLGELTKDTDAPIASLVVSLASFNVGVELGQIAIVILFFLTIGFWTRNQPWYKFFVRIPLSSLIALLGAWWFFERISA